MKLSICPLGVHDMPEGEFARGQTWEARTLISIHIMPCYRMKMSIQSIQKNLIKYEPLDSYRKKRK
jgi:hypothetical protein